MHQLDLEKEITRISLAMMTRNPAIGRDLMANLRIHLSLQEVAGVVLVSLERLLWFDTNSVLWAIDHLIPPEVIQEIRKMTSVAIYRRLIRDGFEPGRDLSVDGNGRLLVNEKAKTTLSSCCLRLI